MSQMFNGVVLLPGEVGEGLQARFERGAETVRLTAGENELGSWQLGECNISPSGKGSFRIVFAGEELMFMPSSPSLFAEAMRVPLAPEPQVVSENGSEDEKPEYDYDAAIDEIIASVKPLRDPNDDDEILSKGILMSIVGASTFVMAGLATAAFML